MILVGSRSPTFECTAIVNCEVQELAWNQLCENKVLVLLESQWFARRRFRS